MTLSNTTAIQYWHVHIRPQSAALDGHGRATLADIRRIGMDWIEGVRSSRLYLLAGRLEQRHVRILADELLLDHVAESCEIGPGIGGRSADIPAVEVHTLPGVMNPVALSTLDAARRLLTFHGANEAQIDELQTARRYEIIGTRSVSDLERIAREVLANDCIEAAYIQGCDRHDALPETFPVPPVHPFELRHVAMDNLDDEGLARLSRDGHLFLSVSEMKSIRDHFRERGRTPTDLELETLAQTWSEHCVHKTLKSAMDYRGDDFGKAGTVTLRIDNLLADTIALATHRLNRDWCLSVFEDNAGVIAFDDDFGVAFKAETHNHPSAIEPYGGAATGIGGCIRDIMGCGLGAKPIASTDVFCVAPPNFDSARLPKDVLHPRRILKGVVSGVRDYGNRMGIPTVNGAIVFDDRYVANPLVFCGCVGLIPKDRIHKQPNAGDLIILVGGRTGRDGIHGATFSSAELTDTHADEFSHAVQIGHAIEEKKVLDALLLARDHESGCLFSAVTDCGAGGLSSAVGEMGEKLGAVVDLERVPLKYTGLRYDEIWVSEAQERMVFAVPPANAETMLRLFADEEVEATVIGSFADDGVLRVRFDGTTVGELDMQFLHHGIPRRTLNATWTAPMRSTDCVQVGGPDSSNHGNSISPNERILAALSELNTASKEWVIRQYDHEVQGRSVIKPLVGPASGPSDAAVLRPVYDSSRGIAIGCGMCPELGDVDPYWMAIAAVDEALRNIICVGADPTHTAILDNFCWPKVDSEESLGALVRTCRGAADAALAFGLPFISGKDSLNNEFSMSAAEAQRTNLPQRIAIPYTLLISSLGVVDDVSQCVTMDLKRPGNRLVVASAPAAPTREELITLQSDEATKRRSDVGTTSGTNEASCGLQISRPPEESLPAALFMHRRVSELIRSGKVVAAHDISDGGLIVALAEMCIASRLGATLDLSHEVYPHCIFDSVTTTYVLEMSVLDARASGLPVLGTVESEPRLRVAINGQEKVVQPVDALATAWRSPLASGGGA